MIRKTKLGGFWSCTHPSLLVLQGYDIRKLEEQIFPQEVEDSVISKINLRIRESMYKLAQIYEEAKYDLHSLLRLHKNLNNLGMGKQEIIKVLELAKYNQLQYLQDKVVSKKIYPEIPPRVEYSLTYRAKELGIVLSSLGNWVRRWNSKIKISAVSKQEGR